MSYLFPVEYIISLLERNFIHVNSADTDKNDKYIFD